jgi:hypothetical protein
VIPAQLAQGNLAAFQDQPGNRYIIYTRPEDAEVIQSSPIFGPLKACVPVTFEFITEKIDIVHDMMTDCFRRGIKVAEDVEAAVLFLTPDIVFSDGSFTTLKHLSDRGHDVIYIPAIRTMKNAVAASLAKSYRRGNATQVSPRQLMRIALDNLHPLGDLSWWEEGEGGLIPANIYWRVDDEGLVGRCFHLHPILVHPQRKNATFFGTVDDDYVPATCPDSSGDYVVVDSDQLLAIELSDPGRFFEMRSAKGSVGDAVRWAEQFTNARHRSLFKAPIRMHTGISQPLKWAAAEDRARVVAEEIELRLDRPVWRLLFDADLLLRRCIQLGKGYRLRFANRDWTGPPLDDNIPAWKSAVLSIIERSADARRSLIKLIRRVANRLEELSARPYQAHLFRDLIDMMPKSSDLVLVANSPGRFHLAPLLTTLSPSFSSSRYVSVLRRTTVSVLEKGEPILNSSKEAVILEIDAYRTKEVEAYLRESHRILCEGGRLTIYLHRLSFSNSSGRRLSIALHELVGFLTPGFSVITTREQGGLGSYLRVEIGSWLRGVINRRLAVRWLVLVFALPMLPLIAIIGGIVIGATALLDFIDRSNKFSISTLVLAQKSGGPN